LLDDHVTDALRSTTLLSEYVPVAVKGTEPLMASVLVDGVTVMAINVAALTVNVVEPESLPTVAVMVVLPAFSVVARCVASSEATVGALEVKVALLDTSDTVPSEKVPVAKNCCVTPTPSVGLVGVTAMETSVALVTVRAPEPVILPTVAVIVLDPAPRPVATPLCETLAIRAFDDVQPAVSVTSWVVLSLKVTTAWKETVPCTAVVAVAGVTVNATTVAVGTVIRALPLNPLTVAVIVAVPGAIAVTTPAVTEADAGLLVFQVACAVTSWVELSE